MTIYRHSRFVQIVGSSIMAFLAGNVSAASPKGDSAILDLALNSTLEGTANGQPVRIIVDPAYPNNIVLNPSFATAARIKKSGMIGFRTTVGPIVVWGGSSVVNFSFGSLPLRQRAILPTTPFTDRADGGAGPGALPYDTINFQLKPTLAGEQVYNFPLVTNPSYKDASSVAVIHIAGKDLVVAFSLQRKNSLATAAAGRLLADVFGGHFSGEPSLQPIAFGVSRPVRNMTLSQPFHFLGRPLAAIDVRTADYGDASQIGKDDSQTRDANEIIVTAQKSGKDTNRYSLVLGLDSLAHCSSISFDKRAKQIRLSCLPI